MEACVWEACLYRATDALRAVTLVHEGRSYLKPRVPLCDHHMRLARETGRVVARAEFLFAPEKR